TRVPAVRVDTTATPVTVTDGPNSAQCSGTSALAALITATGGNWGGYVDPSFGPGVNTVMGESHPITSGERSWSLWVNDKPAELGACSQELDPGDRLLFYVSCFNATTGCVSKGALISSVPAIAAPGSQLAL